MFHCLHGGFGSVNSLTSVGATNKQKERKGGTTLTRHLWVLEAKNKKKEKEKKSVLQLRFKMLSDKMDEEVVRLYGRSLCSAVDSFRI